MSNYHGWTHSVCMGCWEKVHPGEIPVTVLDDKETVCCFCGELTSAGIYVRANPENKELLCWRRDGDGEAEDDPTMSSNDGHTTPDLHQDDGNTTESDDCRQDDPVIPDACGAFVFNLDSAEGERRMRECLDASRFRSVLYEIDWWLRNRIKYNPDADGAPLYIPEDGIKWLEIAREQLHMRCGDYGIRLDEE